jgi:septum formation protein
MREIILASASPRRKQLLELAEIPCTIIPANIDESYPPGLSPDKIAEYIANEKALFIWEELKPNSEEHTILAADTIVVLENEIIGKPINKEDAIQILSKLSGKEHKVITGICNLNKTKKIIFSETTFVQFNILTEAQIVLI